MTRGSVHAARDDAGTAAAPLKNGDDLHALCARLFDVPRSLTGPGVRTTLDVVAEHVPLEVREVPAGTKVLDWTVPPEWRVREAWVAGPDGRRVVDWADNPLHLVGYSTPVRARMSLDALREHLVTLPDRPDLVPYRTAYYAPRWGFCLAQRQLDALPPGEYEVCVDTEHDASGSLTYGEAVVDGETTDEVLVSTHVCHPRGANDNCSGIALATALAQHVAAQPMPRYRYRFLFVPGTIGAISWLAANRQAIARVRHGLVLTGLGDPGAFTYKRSRRGDATVDRVVPEVLAHRGDPHDVVDFSPYGYDERQYCSPGFDLPVGRLTRTPHGEYPEYHTSGDDLDLVTPASLQGALDALRDVVEALECDRTYENLAPYGEPQLGKRGLYRETGAAEDKAAAEQAYLWLLAYSDGRTSLVDIARRGGLSLTAARAAADRLSEVGLLREVRPPGR